MYKDVTGKTGMKGLQGTTGTTYGNMALYSPAELADILMDGISKVENVPAPLPDTATLLAEAVLGKLRDLKDARDYARGMGVDFYEGATLIGRFDTDEVSIANITGAVTNVLAGQVLDPAFTWTDADDNDVAMDEVRLKALGAAMATHVGTVHTTYRTLKAAITAPTITAIDDLAPLVWPWPDGVDPRFNTGA